MFKSFKNPNRMNSINKKELAEITPLYEKSFIRLSSDLKQGS